MKFQRFNWCGLRDSNPHGFPHGPEPCASANSAKTAYSVFLCRLSPDAVSYTHLDVYKRQPLASQLLAGTDVALACVVGFPLGAMSTRSKAFEAEDACLNGASEIDMVINVGRLKDGDDAYVEADIRAVADAAAGFGAAVKVILETCLLTDEERCV